VCLKERDREASIMRRAWPTGGCCDMGKNVYAEIKFCQREITENYSRSVLWDLP
jgi:hypothetical protein